MSKQVHTNNVFGTSSKKGLENRSLRFEPKILFLWLCFFVLLNRYWGIVKVPWSFIQSGSNVRMSRIRFCFQNQFQSSRVLSESSPWTRIIIQSSLIRRAHYYFPTCAPTINSQDVRERDVDSPWRHPSRPDSLVGLAHFEFWLAHLYSLAHIIIFIDIDAQQPFDLAASLWIGVFLWWVLELNDCQSKRVKPFSPRGSVSNQLRKPLLRRRYCKAAEGARNKASSSSRHTERQQTEHPHHEDTVCRCIWACGD